MPELHFQIEWPDGRVTRCYSPSTIVRDYFEEGSEMTIGRLREVSAAAMKHASRRVEQRYGFACLSAADTLQEIHKLAADWSDDEQVRIVRID